MMGALALGKKKPRKPYTVSRTREKWTADEHDRFVHSLLIFGRDWKTIEQFVGTKTATQIRSHAQKYFLKAHKQGLAAALPPPHPRRAAVLSQPPPTFCFVDDAVAASCTSAGACWTDYDDSFMTTTSNGGDDVPADCASRSNGAWFAGSCLLQDDTILLPLSPDDLRFAEVYRFVGDVFGSGAPHSITAQLQRLHGMDPLVAETIVLALRNIEDNLCA
ncbi:hypothetical protein EJB05_33391, partial [Eragrostis curvula]